MCVFSISDPRLWVCGNSVRLPPFLIFTTKICPLSSDGKSRAFTDPVPLSTSMKLSFAKNAARQLSLVFECHINFPRFDRIAVPAVIGIRPSPSGETVSFLCASDIWWIQSHQTPGLAHILDTIPHASLNRFSSAFFHSRCWLFDSMYLATSGIYFPTDGSKCWPTPHHIIFPLGAI